MFRRFVAVIALVFAAASTAACSDDKDATTTPTTTSTPVGTTAPGGDGGIDGGIDGAERRIDAVVGARLSFEASVTPDALGPGGNLASAYKVGSRIVVWMRLAEEPTGVETSAQFGEAEVRSVDADGATFEVTGRVPRTLWRREQRMAPLAALATTPGDYEVVLQNLFTQRITVRAGQAAPASSTTAPAQAPAATRLLGASDLAGVAFGLDEVAAMSGLTSRFGKPSFDEVHKGTCGDERLAGWGSLSVTFRDTGGGTGATGGAGRRTFVGYVYSAPHARVTDGPRDLRTTSGLAPGASVADMQAREPGVVFVTDQVGYAATTWYASPGSRLGGRISDDVSAEGVTVIEIAASAASSGAATYAPC